MLLQDILLRCIWHIPQSLQIMLVFTLFVRFVLRTAFLSQGFQLLVLVRQQLHSLQRIQSNQLIQIKDYIKIHIFDMQKATYLCLFIILLLTQRAQSEGGSCEQEQQKACNANAPKTTIWLDCDPGLDDTIAIVYAAKSDGINLLGVSTSGGNTNLKYTTKNTLDILSNVGRQDVLVVKGSDKLVYGESKYAEEIHGEGGLGGVVIPASSKSAVEENNFKTIRDTILASKDKVTWANTGALTNLCMLLEQYPDVKQNIDRIVIMGGAIGRGNMSPAAEFNILFDPVAYERVLKIKGSIPLVMIPLEVTHEVRAREPIFNFLQQHSQIPFAKAVLSMLLAFKEMYFKYENFDFPPIHDACVINYILHPEDFELKRSKIVVDTGEVSYGRTNCYFNDPHDPLKQIDSIDKVAIRMRRRSAFWKTMEKIFTDIFEKSA